jgi:predicted nucleic acid-binding Zn ribbon protein
MEHCVSCGVTIPDNSKKNLCTHCREEVASFNAILREREELNKRLSNKLYLDHVGEWGG